MYTNSILAVSGALLSVVAAVPMAKREVVWVTQTDEAFVTVPVTQTVWVDPSSSTVTKVAHHHYHRPTSKSAVSNSTVAKSTVTSHVQSTVTFGAASTSAKSTVTSHVQSTVTFSAAPTSSETPETTAESTSVSVAPISTSTSIYVAPTTTSSSVYVAPTTSSVIVAPTTSSVSIAPTTSSVSVAPTTTSTTKPVVPTTTSISIAPTTSTTSTAAAAASTSASSGSGETSGPGAVGTTYTGDLTWYATGLGACGWTNTASDHIVAISEVIFDAYATPNPNNNPMCGLYVDIIGKDGSTYSAKIVDRCTGCKEGDLDLSEDFFNTVTENGNGRVSGMTWSFA